MDENECPPGTKRILFAFCAKVLIGALTSTPSISRDSEWHQRWKFKSDCSAISQSFKKGNVIFLVNQTRVKHLCLPAALHLSAFKIHCKKKEPILFKTESARNNYEANKKTCKNHVTFRILWKQHLQFDSEVGERARIFVLCQHYAFERATFKMRCWGGSIWRTQFWKRFRILKWSFSVLWPVTEHFMIGTGQKEKILEGDGHGAFQKLVATYTSTVLAENRKSCTFSGFVRVGIAPEFYLQRCSVFKDFKILHDLGGFFVDFELLRSCCLRRRCVLWESMCFFKAFEGWQVHCSQYARRHNVWRGHGTFKPCAWFIQKIRTPILAPLDHHNVNVGMVEVGAFTSFFFIRSLWLKLFRFKNPVLDLHKRGQ